MYGQLVAVTIAVKQGPAGRLLSAVITAFFPQDFLKKSLKIEHSVIGGHIKEGVI